MRIKWIALPLLIFASGLLLSATEGDCSFLNNPDEYTVDTERSHTLRSDLTARVSVNVYAAMAADKPAGQPIEASSIPRKNFIDDYIFGRMAGAGIQSAPIASDAEFLRRATLDLTGRIPSASEVEAFLADSNPAKRDLKVDALIGTPEFIDKWTMFFGDLFKVTAQATNVNRGIPGRDAFYLYLKEAMTQNRPYDVMAREMIAATGDSFENGAANWPVGNTVAMGPAQDTYDGQAVNLASMFLGINAVDCLLCHDGARHLDLVNLWGSSETRQRMWGLSAYFARTRMQRVVVTQTPLLTKFVVSDLNTGNYNLNTTSGNRSARQPINGVASVSPSNPFRVTAGPIQIGSGIMAGESYRQAIARQITGDIQFSRAAVNYIWEKFMVEALVSPSNAFDLARLDPSNPPPSPWTLQPTNPELLAALSSWFQANRYDLRALMRLIAKSSAYQLSAVYPGQWDVSYVPYYARKFVRRLDAEEVHDAVAKATGISASYTFTNSSLPPVQWAMQLPDTREPLRATGDAANFLNSFGRGDRDTLMRRSEGSVLQALTLMNSPFVMSRIHQNNQGSRVAALLSQGAQPETIIRQLFLNTLSRPPTSQETALFLPAFQQQGNRAAAEGLQWLLLNKLDFLFNY